MEFTNLKVSELNSEELKAIDGGDPFMRDLGKLIAKGIKSFGNSYINSPSFVLY